MSCPRLSAILEPIFPGLIAPGGAGKGPLTDLPHSLMAGEPVWFLEDEKKFSAEMDSWRSSPCLFPFFLIMFLTLPTAFSAAPWLSGW